MTLMKISNVGLSVLLAASSAWAEGAESMRDRGGGGGRNGSPPRYSPPGHQQPPRQQPPVQQPPRQQPPRQEPPRRNEPPPVAQPPGHRPPRYEPPRQEPPRYEPPRQQPPFRRPIRRVRPSPIPPPRYVPVVPDRPWRPSPGVPSQPGQVEREYEYLGRVFWNEEIPLRALFDIDQDFRGYSIDSIQVEAISVGDYSSRISLEVNGLSVDSDYNPNGWILLDPGMWDQIGTEIRTLRLDVRGRVHIGGIYINLRRYGYDAPADRVVRVTVPSYLLPRRMFGNDRINLGQLINLNDYVGFMVEEIQITGEAMYNNAFLDVLVNGGLIGPSMVFQSGYYGQVQVVRPLSRPSVGYAMDAIALQNRGDLNLRSITLILSRW